MKVHYRYGLSGYSGTIDEAVYYYHPKLKLSLMREYVRPKNKKNTDRMIAIMANLKLLHPSEGYRLNFADYLQAYNDLKENSAKPALSWNNLYMKMLYALQKTDSRVDLKTLTREQITEMDLPCKSLKAAVEAGLLPEVKNYQRWDVPI